MRGLVDIARTKGKKSERTIRQVVVILALKYFSQATSTEKTTRKHVVVRQVAYNGVFCLWVIMHPHMSVTFYSIRRILDSSPSQKRAHEEKKRDGRENRRHNSNILCWALGVINKLGLILSILEFPRGGKFLKKLWRCMGGSVTG